MSKIGSAMYSIKPKNTDKSWNLTIFIYSEIIQWTADTFFEENLQKYEKSIKFLKIKKCSKKWFKKLTKKVPKSDSKVGAKPVNFWDRQVLTGLGLKLVKKGGVAKLQSFHMNYIGIFFSLRRAIKVGPPSWIEHLAKIHIIQRHSVGWIDR